MAQQRSAASFSGLVVAVVALCALPMVADGLKCVQCGQAFSLEEVQELSRKIAEGRAFTFCPRDLPAPSECPSASQQFCAKTDVDGKTSRFCSAYKLENCNGGMCFNSCNSDGCNGAERGVAASSYQLLLVLAAVLCSRWIRP